MTPAPGLRLNPPQAFLSSYAPRVRTYGNSLLAPVIPQTTAIPIPKSTRRGTQAVNYAEDGYDDDFEDSEGPRRPTGLRSLRREDTETALGGQHSQIGKEIHAPVDVQGIWREYMGKPRRTLTEKQLQIQNVLPLTLIPIRIDLDIQPFRPDAPLPMPQNARDFGVDETSVAYRIPDVTPAFRLKDAFLWNLHEALITPDQFAKNLVDELDLPQDRKPMLISQITTQIRSQLEEYAGVALHPLFHATTATAPRGTTVAVAQAADELSREASSMPPLAISGATTATNGATHGTTNGVTSGAINGDGNGTPLAAPNGVTAKAQPILSNEDVHNPDDTYRCVVTLRINLMNRLYSDKFEWSLLHPPGFAENFSKQTCADLGLAAEWVPAMAYAIYEAVLTLKKEACENGGLIGYQDIDNDAAEGVEAGWRYEPERLAAEWEPVIENLTKDEIENRERERERQMRRVRRETARFSSTANMAGGMPQPGDYFADPAGGDTPMGRGERSKKKRRFRSLSPVGRDTPNAEGYGGGAALSEWERNTWKCDHCRVWGHAVWAVRDGPSGARTLCNNCGLLYERDKKLPPWSHLMFQSERSFITTR